MNSASLPSCQTVGPSFKPRNSHSKSRGGCLFCKSRHTKCDQVKPSCGNCLRWKKECEYPAPRTRGASAAPYASPYPVVNTASPSTGPPTTSEENQPSIGSSQIDNQIPDFRLFHHYVTVTARTLTADSRERDACSSYTVKLAFEQPFLLHGLLSIAALHLSRTDSVNSQQYLSQATHHHDLALSRFRADVHQVNESNLPAVLCFATVNFPYYYALPAEDGSPDHILDLEIQHLTLIRGIRPVVSPFWPQLFETEFAQFISKEALSVDWGQTPMQTEISYLRHLPETVNSPEETKDIFRDAIRLLENLYQQFTPRSDPSSLSTLRFWPHLISAKFIDLMTVRDPIALVIFSHYAVLVRRSESYWFMEGASSRIMRMVNALLGGSWEEWLEWPRRQILS